MNFSSPHLSAALQGDDYHILETARSEKKIVIHNHSDLQKKDESLEHQNKIKMFNFTIGAIEYIETGYVVFCEEIMREPNEYPVD